MYEPPKDAEQQFKDLGHLNSLVIGHNVAAGLFGVGSLCGIPYTLIGVTAINDPKAWATPGRPNPFPFHPGMMFVVAGLALLFFASLFALFTYQAGRYLAQRKNYNFIFWVNAVICIAQPIGTILGVFTMIVLSRPSVKSLFAGEPPR